MWWQVSAMQAIVETLFDICYLVTVLTVGIRMIRGAKGSRQFELFGWMAVVLGAGDSFHLVPALSPFAPRASTPSPSSWASANGLPR